MWFCIRPTQLCVELSVAISMVYLLGSMVSILVDFMKFGKSWKITKDPFWRVLYSQANYIAILECKFLLEAKR